MPRKAWADDPPDQFIHNDPEFVTFTYGSPRHNSKRTKEKNYDGLSGMNDGDVLVFYAAFSRDGDDIDGYYFFAYFVVDRVIKWSYPDNLSQDDQDLVKNNHHFIHRRQDQVVVVGKRDESKVFEKAILLSSRVSDKKRSNYYPCQSIQQNLEYNKSMNRSSLRKFSGLIAGSFKEYLDLRCT